MKKGDKIRFFDNFVDHINGKKGIILEINKGLNCISIVYGDEKTIQVNRCQVIEEKENGDT